ncbi:MAG: lipase family protein [Candidatus Sulfotelmatobacter sp.]
MGHPLDPEKAFFYGQFVQAVYAMFANSQGGDALRPGPAGIPEGYELGAWIHMSDFILNLEKPQFYGIVVHNIANPDARIIAIRGTEGALEWFDDAFAFLTRFRQVTAAGKVAQGFDKIYRSLKVVRRALPNERRQGAAALPETFGGSFAEQLEQLAISRETARAVAPFAAEGRARPARPTVVTGHSLGSALTTLFVLENAEKHKFDIATQCTFASPRVGNTEFVRVFNQLPIDSWRIVNTDDEVPRLPFRLPLFDYQHVDAAYAFSSDGFAKHSLVCCHAMETYLHWLNASSPVRPSCLP